MTPRSRIFSPEERLEVVPFRPTASSSGLGWGDLRAEEYGFLPHTEFAVPPLDHHVVVFHWTTAPTIRLSCGDTVHTGPVGGNTVSVVPAGHPSEFHVNAHESSFLALLSARLLKRVGAETFGMDPDRMELRPAWGRSVGPVQAVGAMVRAELLGGGVGGRLCAESFATIIAVHLIRDLASIPVVRGLTGVLAASALRAVEEYITDNLDKKISLVELAGVVHLSEYHFARLFKATTGQSPHQFVIQQRVEQAKQLLRGNQRTLAQVAAAVGFSDQSQLHRHFKRLVGVTPRRFS